MAAATTKSKTDGAALKTILSTQNVDSRHNFINDVVQIFNGSYIDYRHLALLGNMMTAKGHLMTITREDIDRRDIESIMRCSFELLLDVEKYIRVI